ncbi:MAG: hypothetical protein KJ569_07970, partial [Candidatus Omnitrophica bacterium]|nr:hypothetical protein [Candidatus Omnitrophota bacterium]
MTPWRQWTPHTVPETSFEEAAKNFLFLDIEAGGVSPQVQRGKGPYQLLSLYTSTGPQNFKDIAQRTTYVAPRLGQPISGFSAQTVLPQLVGKQLVPETEALNQFYSTLQGAKGKHIVGWNIGSRWQDWGQAGLSVPGYDIPFLQTRAGLLGGAQVGRAFREAGEKTKLWDVALSYRQFMAQPFVGASEDIGKMEAQQPSLFRIANEMSQTERAAAVAGMTEAELAEWNRYGFLKQWHAFGMATPERQVGMQLKGWSAEFLHQFWGKKLFGEEAYEKMLAGYAKFGVGHEAAYDIEARTKDLASWIMDRQGAMEEHMLRDPRAF